MSKEIMFSRYYPSYHGKASKPTHFAEKVLMQQGVDYFGIEYRELKQIQGFPRDYKLMGTKTEQKKYIGNAVEVNQAKAIVSSKMQALVNHFQINLA